jgi:hypothetical protein
VPKTEPLPGQINATAQLSASSKAARQNNSGSLGASSPGKNLPASAPFVMAAGFYRDRAFNAGMQSLHALGPRQINTAWF